MTEEVTVLFPEGADWRICESPGRRCQRCGVAAVFELNRGVRVHGRRFAAWWGYCAEHAYGRVLLDDGIYLATHHPYGLVS